MPRTDKGWETSDYRSIYDPEAEREHGPSDLLDVLHEDGTDREIRLTVDEMDGFERYEETLIRSDTLDHEDFEHLLRWLEEEGL